LALDALRQLAAEGAVCDVVDVAAHEAEIVKLAIGERGQALAGHAGVVPRGDVADKIGKDTGGAEASAEGAVRHKCHRSILSDQVLGVA